MLSVTFAGLCLSALMNELTELTQVRHEVIHSATMISLTHSLAHSLTNELLHSLTPLMADSDMPTTTTAAPPTAAGTSHTSSLTLS